MGCWALNQVSHVPGKVGLCLLYPPVSPPKDPPPKPRQSFSPCVQASKQTFLPQRHVFEACRPILGATALLDEGITADCSCPGGFMARRGGAAALSCPRWPPSTTPSRNSRASLGCLLGRVPGTRGDKGYVCLRLSLRGICSECVRDPSEES